MAKKLKTTSPTWSHDRGHGLRNAFGESDELRELHELHELPELPDEVTKKEMPSSSSASNDETPPPSRPSVGDIAPW
ncbi:hypothetical protein AKJ09_10502 [Labilithrix luteola]|uniref:Uncharacterized protein n=1 Tax=Labilithrix luteola TaxID=1391654 RepID=A0A0K1QDK0_9BACT|nr:hypothetical protein [Labilithrix luteola]AKV03839.1 hypothetical protein AKJ09_10502 [Labilithrix luteola]